MKSPTIQQLTSYKLGKEGLKVKLNNEEFERISLSGKLTGYFNNDFRVVSIDFEDEFINLFNNDNFVTIHNIPLSWIELQVKPMSLLASEIEHKGEKFIPMEKFFRSTFPRLKRNEEEPFKYDFREHIIDCISSPCRKLIYVSQKYFNHNYYDDVKQLIEWEFDIYGLNEQ